MNETVKIVGPVDPAGSSGYLVNRVEPVVPSAEETLEHLEQTLDNLDPVPATAPTVGAISDAAVDSVIAEITGASVEAVEPAVVDNGPIDEKAE